MAENPSLPPRTNSSPVRMSESFEARRQLAHREMASLAPDEATALRLAKLLVGLWPLGRPDNPDAFLFGLGKLLEDYPVLVGEACCDPRRGLPRTREIFPTLKVVADWCSDRVELNNKLIEFERRRSS